MSTTLTLADYMATLSRPELERMLARRPSTLFDWPSRNLDDIAKWWLQPWSMVQSLSQLPRPALEVLKTLAALVQGVRIEVLCDRLEQHGTAAEHRDQVEGTLRSLQDHGLAWIGPDRGIWVSPDIDGIIPRPLGLGPGVDRHVRYFTVDAIKSILGAVGLPVAGRRGELVRRLLDFYVDTDRIRKILASATEATQRDLAIWAIGLSPYSDDDDAADRQRVDASFRWGRSHGFLFGNTYENDMPAPIVMAMRSSDFRAEYHPAPPDLPLARSSLERVDAAAGTAATYFDSLSLSVLDGVASQGLPLLAKGGIGVRELAKLGDRIKAPGDEVRVVLELASAANLLWRYDSRLTTDAAYEVWRAAEPADRIAVLIASWWNLGHIPSVYRTPDGRSQPALQEMSMGGPDARVRHRGVEMLADLQPSDIRTTAGVADRDAFAARLSWERPLVIGQETAIPQAIWDEGHLLGVMADGACTAAGRALLAFDGDALGKAVRAILPPAATTGSFGSDLTVMVAGAPSGAAAQLLDACAVRESRGQASVWRFSPATVRRALDDGWRPDQLLEALQGLASTGLPQTLTYLIGDVARRHGTLKVATGGCALISDDTALLTEVCAARALRHLRLTSIAPTVVLALADPVTTIDSLRNAGYMPMPDGAGGLEVLRAPAVSGRVADRAEGQRREAGATSNFERVGKLLAAPDRVPPAKLRRKVQEVAQRVFRDPTGRSQPQPPPPSLFS